ncbi:MAG: glucose-6-phosphate isomerase [Desulfovibrio sp.]|nr:glucose-6-phosphate isomerase [Desulfovibrio sp.]
MPNYLEWSRAYTGRIQEEDAHKRQAKAQALGDRLHKEMAEGILPFLTMPYRKRMEEDLARVLPVAQNYRHMLLLGIGGSALGCRAIQHAFAPGQDLPNHTGPSVWVVDNVCAEQLEALLGSLSPKETIVVTISKSGGTIETLSQYFLVKQWLKEALGDAWHRQMIVVTDLVKGYLRDEAKRLGLASMEVPDYLGGRYSALSAVGLLPAAYLGVDWKGLIDGAASVAKPLVDNPASIATHPAFALASWADALMERDYSQLIFFSYIPKWAVYGPWFAQLWAESLGKGGKGSQPIPATGVTDQHSINQMFLDGRRDKACLFVTSQNNPKGRAFGDDLPEKWSWLRPHAFGDLLEAEALGTKMALCQSKVPLVELSMADSDAYAAGAMMLLLEATTVFTGWLMGINPVDQPAVELGKRLANCRLGATGYTQEEADLAAFFATKKVEQPF